VESVLRVAASRLSIVTWFRLDKTSESAKANTAEDEFKSLLSDAGAVFD
jgi:hypothetical protein